MDLLNILASESFWAASLRIATPLIFGVLGALICERSGVLNLGIEGIFVVGAMCGWMAVWLGAGLWGGVLLPSSTGSHPFYHHPRYEPIWAVCEELDMPLQTHSGWAPDYGDVECATAMFISEVEIRPPNLGKRP